ncbi:hypothetical protein DL346_11355 [Paenibacillus montanisoli]|uniref:EamA domain-containing protein n=1 Tax=Paenibacillus montanisoli TaxID=2081970 RepID=A0A328U510_9BACL|nr:hypothetical protein DL346_11355 [Paenibacillus montanisoli]
MTFISQFWLVDHPLLLFLCRWKVKLDLFFDKTNVNVSNRCYNQSSNRSRMWSEWRKATTLAALPRVIKETYITMQDRTVLFKLCAVSLLWGGNYVASAYMLRDFSPIYLSFARLVVMSLFLISVALVGQSVRRPTIREF